MDLRQLEMFKAIVETGSFTRAGEKLFVSQPAISRQIRILEEELGDKVFRRIGKRVELTPVGEVVWRHAQLVFGQIQQLVSDVADLNELKRGTLRLAGGMSVCTYLFPKLMDHYQQRFPRIEFNILTGTNDELIRLLEDDQVDVALMTLPVRDPDLEVQPALKEEMVLLVPEGHPLAGRPSVTPRDLGGSRFIHFETGSNTRKIIDDIFDAEEVHFEETISLQNVEITKPLVEAGLGISIVPYPAVANVKEKLVFRRLHGRRILRTLGWVYRKSNYIPGPVLELLALFDEKKKQLCPRYRAQPSRRSAK